MVFARSRASAAFVSGEKAGTISANSTVKTMSALRRKRVVVRFIFVLVTERDGTGGVLRPSTGALDDSRALVASFRSVTDPAEPPVYLHIGFCKTGTKALQGSVFAKLDELHLWGNGPLEWEFNDPAQHRAIELLSEIVRSETWEETDAKWLERYEHWDKDKLRMEHSVSFYRSLPLT